MRPQDMARHFVLQRIINSFQGILQRSFRRKRDKFIVTVSSAGKQQQVACLNVAKLAQGMCIARIRVC